MRTNSTDEHRKPEKMDVGRVCRWRLIRGGLAPKSDQGKEEGGEERGVPHTLTY